jgi:hypothetical protein
MPTASIKAFDGLKPLVDPILLEGGSAQVANNVKLISGAIMPLKGVTTLKALTKSIPKTIFRYGDSSVETEHWLEFLERTDVMRSPIVDNQFGMLYWADGVQVRYAPNNVILSGSTYPGGSYNLGVPAPPDNPTVSGSAPTASSKSVTLTAVYTYVTAYGEEGPPSKASNVATLNPDQNITVGNMSTAPSGPYNVTLKRIYVSSTVGTGAEFQFWKEVPVSSSSVTGSYDQAALGEVLPSADWVAPPANLKGLRMMANGIAVGFVENTAYVSEPNLPHAWPNTYPSDYKIVGVGAFGQSSVFLTNGFPYILSGVDPAAMTFERLALPQACVSIDSIVETGNAVYYASPDGLVVISSGGIDIATKDLLTPEQWRAYNPESIRAALHENRYVGLYQKSDGSRGVMIFDFSGAGARFTTSDLNSAAEITAMYYDPRSDTLYLAQGTNIVRYDRGSALTYTWRSKSFRLPAPINFGFGQVIADAYPVTMKVYADGQLKITKTVADANLFRLPSGFRAVDWMMELVGSSKITQALITTSTSEAKAT